jgi:gliding motility-associated-like protein
MRYPQNFFFRLKSLLLIFGLTLPGYLFGAHIVGGEITYQCLGNGQYIFTMKVYRDCNSDGAQFDAQAAISIYRAGSSSTFLITTLKVSHLPVTEIDPEIGPCFEAPDVCVEEAIYISGVVDLPVLTEDSYVITYQRCCRNNTISNIFVPGESGASYTIELTPEAQQSCNNSPTFNDFPPIVICANSPLVFDHSASDQDGDQLVYELCSPLLGGGLDGSPGNPGDPNSFTGVMPDPAAPPPYNEVAFITPTYDPSSPMGGNPPVTINPQTGLITGTPTTLGQFVVGVCVKEFRNGELLSIVRRDFQFNVTPCQPFVFADIQEDEIIGPKEYVVNSCGNNTVTFINESIQESNIFAYDWTFDLGNGSTLSGTTEDFTATFPDTGTYVGQLLLNGGSECSDSATIYVNVFPEVVANFDFSYDTCLVEPVSFQDLSFSGSGTITDWLWDFDDGTVDTLPSPDHLFASAGDKEVLLQVRDINDCIHDTIKTVRWYPVPELLIIEPSRFEGCEPLPVFFNNLSFPVDSTYDIVWDFGDGNGSGELSPSHVFEEEGTYSVSLEITSPVGCFNSVSFSDWIEVSPSPVAGFDYSPKELSNFNADVSFFDESVDAETWYWEFGEFGTSILQEPRYSFPDTGVVEVMQVVTHLSGCRDTAYARLDIIPRITFFMPNAFTPNLDNKNDFFGGVGFFEWARDFEMTIWNRWGELIFETNDPATGWNGKKNNTGNYVPQGVYLYRVRFLGPRGKPYEYRGYATLIM